LSACGGNEYAPVWTLVIEELSSGTCEGNLKVRIASGDTLVFEGETSQNVRPPDELLERSTPYEVEAFCLAEDESELGYAMHAGELVGSSPIGASTLIVRDEPLEEGVCVELAEQRGAAPCISTRLF